MATPRGIQNNNPGNIIITSTPWQGKVPVPQNTDKVFEQFTSMVYGVRALIKNLYSYFVSDKNLTLREIAYKWNPDSNPANVEAYTKYLEEKTGYGRDTVLIPSELVLSRLTKAITEIENGYTWGIPDGTIKEAYDKSGIDLPEDAEIKKKEL